MLLQLIFDDSETHLYFEITTYHQLCLVNPESRIIRVEVACKSQFCDSSLLFLWGSN